MVNGTTLNETCLPINDELMKLSKDFTLLPLTVTIFAVLYSVIILMAILGNLAVILAIFRTRSLQIIQNFFIFALSCSDLVVCVTSATFTPITAFKKTWIFGRTLCSLSPLIAGTSLCFSTFILTAISIDRFLLIYFPTRAFLTKTRAIIVTLGIWISAISLSTPIMLKQNLRSIGRFCGMFCMEVWDGNIIGRQAYGLLMISVQFVIPLSIIIFCYTAISVKATQRLITRSCERSYEWQAVESSRQRKVLRRKHRRNRMLIAMVIAFSMSWFSNVTFNLLRDFNCLPNWILEQEYFLGILTHFLAITSTIWNPLLYAIMNPSFRSAFVNLGSTCLKS